MVHIDFFKSRTSKIKMKTNSQYFSRLLKLQENCNYPSQLTGTPCLKDNSPTVVCFAVPLHLTIIINRSHQKGKGRLLVATIVISVVKYGICSGVLCVCTARRSHVYSFKKIGVANEN